MNAGPFENILRDGYAKNKLGQNTIASSQWLRNKAKELGNSVSRNSVISDRRRTETTQMTGRMFFMNYDPKHKETLPYYDRYPLFFLVDFKDNGFFGINLHYLPPILRAKLMDQLYSLLTNTKFNESTRLQVSYSILKSASGLGAFKPCFKRYLYGHILGGPAFIHPVEWNIVLQLPWASFVKASTGKVWSDSMKILSDL